MSIGGQSARGFDFCNYSIKVKAEEPFKSKNSGDKRIDLLFYSERCVVEVKAKFYAPVNNDLESYANYIEQFKKDKNLPKEADELCVVIGCTEEQCSAVGEEWSFAYWVDVLRNWELLLSREVFKTNVDTDFSHLRATIWSKLG